MLYQTSIFVFRSSTPFIRIHSLYIPSSLEMLNLAVLLAHAMYNYLPNIYFVFAIILWEGPLGGLVYVRTFTEITEVETSDEWEFSLGVVTVSDSAGICVAGLFNLRLEM